MAGHRPVADRLRRPTARAAIAVAVLVIALPMPAWGAPVDGRHSYLAPEPFPHLAPGDEGQPVARLQSQLAAAGFYHRVVDGVYGPETASAVVAFHKYLRAERIDEFRSSDWHLLGDLPGPGLPDRGDATDSIEIDIERQLLFVVRDGAVLGVLPVSTGGGQTYWSARSKAYARATTPLGDFTLRWRQHGWVTDRTTGWSVYKYWAFHDFYGIHGYGSVPTTPASHGCVRLHVWDADWIEAHLFIGMRVHIWNEPLVSSEPRPKRVPAVAKYA